MYTLAFSLITFFWVLELIIHRPDRSKEGLTERRSLRFIWLALMISIAISAITSHFELTKIFGDARWQIVGLIIYACGVLMRAWGIHTLGSNFSRHIKVTEQTTLISHGPYRFLAHPLYFGILLCLSGIALALNTWLGLVASWLLMLPMLIYRIKLEERAMTGQFGEVYTSWLKQRRRLIPFLY